MNEQKEASPKEMQYREERQRRVALGKEGKLWRLEVTGKIGNEIKRYERENMTGDEIRLFREDVYKIGLMLPLDPGHWIVIHPADLLEIHIWKQKHFFDR